MRYVVLAAGFDGTLARDGRCESRTVATLRSLAASGRKLVLVTSRELRDLFDIFPDAGLFDYLIAENGAVVHRPSTRESAILAPAPPEVLIHELRRRHVAPLSIGSAVLTTICDHRDVVSETIARLKLDYRLLQNHRSLAVLPSDVNKASGVSAALADLRLSPHNLVAIGDAENDFDLFAIAEHAVALGNAAPSVKRVADRITRASYAAGFVELARELMETDLRAAPVRRKIVLGTHGGDHEVTLSPRECSLLMSGPKASGKAALCNSVIGQYLAQQYQCCVIGAYPARRQQDLASLTMLGDAQDPPRVDRILATLDEPTQSVLVNLVSLHPNARGEFLEKLFRELANWQDRTGRPHAVIVDQAESLMTATNTGPAEQLRAAARIYLTSQCWNLPRELLDATQVVIALGDPAMTYDTFAQAESFGEQEHLIPGQALIWWRESGIAPYRIQLDLRTAAPAIIPDERVPSIGVTARSSTRAPDDAPALP